MEQRVEAGAGATHLAVDHHHKVNARGAAKAVVQPHAQGDEEVKVVALQAGAGGAGAAAGEVAALYCPTGGRLGGARLLRDRCRWWRRLPASCACPGRTWTESFSK